MDRFRLKLRSPWQGTHGGAMCGIAFVQIYQGNDANIMIYLVAALESTDRVYKLEPAWPG
jgi:hypothetical protein